MERYNNDKSVLTLGGIDTQNCNQNYTWIKKLKECKNDELLLRVYGVSIDSKNLQVYNKRKLKFLWIII